MTDLAWISGEDLEERLERLEPALYLIAFGLALALRWLNLGAAPLGDAEAGWAVQALQLARPDPTTAAQVGSNPGYIVMTGLSFWLMGATDFLARAWPALSGALLVAGVYLFRRDLGRSAAVILAFGLALDPGLVTVSRQAGSPMPALVFAVLAFGLWRSGWVRLAGVAAGLALLGGPSMLPGLASLALAAWAASAVRARLAQHYAGGEVSGGGYAAGRTAAGSYPAGGYAAEEPDADWEDHSHAPHASNSKAKWRAALIAAVITLVLAGTALLRVPQGLPALLGSVTDYFQGWGEPGPSSARLLLLALVTFELLPLVFALIHLGRAAFDWDNWDDDDIILVVFNGVWAFAAILLALIYPARQTSYLVWGIVPLWVLAARELQRYLPETRTHVMSLMQALMVVVLATLFWITLTTTPVLVQPEVSWETLRLIILAGIVVLMVLTSALVALGWSWPISRDGSAWGGLAALLVFSISMLWGASQLRPNQPQELWGQGPGPAQARLLTGTLRDLSLWERGMSHEIEVVSNVDAPSLRWALRSYQNAHYGGLPGRDLTAGEMPAIVITMAQVQNPELTANYRGQDFAWWTRPAWEGDLPGNLREWITYRSSPVVYDHIILWARTDLFPGVSDTP